MPTFLEDPEIDSVDLVGQPANGRRRFAVVKRSKLIKSHTGLDADDEAVAKLLQRSREADGADDLRGVIDDLAKLAVERGGGTAQDEDGTDDDSPARPDGESGTGDGAADADGQAETGQDDGDDADEVLTGEQLEREYEQAVAEAMDADEPELDDDEARVVYDEAYAEAVAEGV